MHSIISHEQVTLRSRVLEWKSFTLQQNTYVNCYSEELERKRGLQESHCDVQEVEVTSVLAVRKHFRLVDEYCHLCSLLALRCSSGGRGFMYPCGQIARRKKWAGITARRGRSRSLKNQELCLQRLGEPLFHLHTGLSCSVRAKCDGSRNR